MIIYLGTLGKTGYLNIWLPNKDKRKTLVKKYNRKPSSVHFEDVPEEKYVEEVSYIVRWRDRRYYYRYIVIESIWIDGRIYRWLER